MYNYFSEFTITPNLIRTVISIKDKLILLKVDYNNNKKWGVTFLCRVLKSEWEGGKVNWGLLIIFLPATCTRQASFVVQVTARHSTAQQTPQAQQTHSLRRTSVLTCSIVSSALCLIHNTGAFCGDERHKILLSLLLIRTFQIFSLNTNHIETTLF